MPYRLKWGDYEIECDDPAEVIDFVSKSEEVEHLVGAMLAEKLRAANKRISELESAASDMVPRGAAGRWPKYRAAIRDFILEHGPTDRKQLLSECVFPHCKNGFHLTMRHDLFCQLDSGLWTLAELSDPAGQSAAPGAPPEADFEDDEQSPPIPVYKYKGLHRDAAVEWLKANGPANRSTVAKACSIPSGSTTAVFRHELFVELIDQRIGLAGVHEDEPLSPVDPDEPIVELVEVSKPPKPEPAPVSRPVLDSTPRESPVEEPPRAPRVAKVKISDPVGHKVPTDELSIVHRLGMFLDENPERTFEEIARALDIDKKLILKTLNSDERFYFDQSNARWSLAETAA